MILQAVAASRVTFSAMGQISRNSICRSLTAQIHRNFDIFNRDMNQISPFEYVSILVSIILGLGITQLLTALGHLLRHYKMVRLFWPHTIWIGFILFLHIQDWFVTYQLRQKTVWTLTEVLFVLLYPIVLYIITKIILPEKGKKHIADLEEYYYSKSGIFFGLLSVAILLSILFNTLLIGNTLVSQATLFCFFGASIFLSVTAIRQPMIHKIFAILVLIGTVVSVFLEKEEWVIR